MRRQCQNNVSPSVEAREYPPTTLDLSAGQIPDYAAQDKMRVSLISGRFGRVGFASAVLAVFSLGLEGMPQRKHRKRTTVKGIRSILRLGLDIYRGAGGLVAEVHNGELQPETAQLDRRANLRAELLRRRAEGDRLRQPEVQRGQGVVVRADAEPDLCRKRPVLPALN